MHQSAKSSGVPVKAFPEKWLPILPENAKPVTQNRVVLNSGRDPGLEYIQFIPQQGSRYNHKGKANGQRQIIFRSNKRPDSSDVPEWPFDPVILSMPQYEEFMRMAYDKPSWNVTEDYEAP